MATFTFEEAMGSPPEKAGKTFTFEEAWGRKKPAEPEEMAFGERLASALSESPRVRSWFPAAGSAVDLLAGGNVRGSAAGRLAMGAADPGVAAFQLAANAVGAGDAVNRRIREVEGEYQDARKAAGSTGFDPLRVVGNVAITAPLGAVGTAAKGVMGLVTKGAVQGALGGALAPVTEEGDFLGAKARQVGTGAVSGAVLSPAVAALSRVVSPAASVNPSLRTMREAGVRPTVGQALGGAWNKAEEKLQSLPIMGDAIAASRRRAIEDFNEAAINRATAPVGKSVRGSGQEAVAKAGDILSDAYESAIGKIKGVAFDSPQFNADLGNLQRLASGLEPAHAARFDRALKDVVLGRMSPNGSMIGSTFKKVDSELGQIASRYGRSPMAGEQELADAVRELQNVLRQQVARSSPEFSAAIKAADKGWANLVRVENAAGRAVNSGGVFTPGQLNMAARTLDRSVRKRATGRGEALMQDLAGPAQDVLGNRVPDSGTPGRALMAAGSLLSGLIHPAIPAGLVAGAGAYTPPVQNMLVYLLSRRPDLAPKLARGVRALAGPAAVGGSLYASGR